MGTFADVRDKAKHVLWRRSIPHSRHMDDLATDIQRRYLNNLGSSVWDDEDPRLDYGICAMPYFITAFRRENILENRSRLVRIIWQFREMTALPILAEALQDESENVWKEALDGIVTLKGDQ